MKKQYWLDEWEADLVTRSLKYVQKRSLEVAGGEKPQPREKFCGLFTADMLQLVIDKFDVDPSED